MESRARLLSANNSPEAEHASPSSSTTPIRTTATKGTSVLTSVRHFPPNHSHQLTTPPESPTHDALSTLLQFSAQLPKATAPRRLAPTLFECIECIVEDFLGEFGAPDSVSPPTNDHTPTTYLWTLQGVLFGVLKDGQGEGLDVKAALKVLEFLTDIKSERVDEFREACDRRFEVSTVFKLKEELEALRKKVLVGDDKVTEEVKEEVKEDGHSVGERA
ncbi:hypothetical protein C0991_005198 [Blastosporella zonata]|nr:hypothetical protein C0991_005198 [Blastosporella zonata]